MMDAFELIRDWFGSMGPETWTTFGSAIVALLSFFFNWRMVRRQERRESTALKLAHDTDVIRWSDEVILELALSAELLAEKGVSYPEQDFRGRRSGQRARLSALIDRGRLFFPNQRDGVKGVEKEEAYQGSRQPALEVLVLAYDLLGVSGEAPGPDRDASEQVNKHRRRFVAEVFKAVDPERRGSTLKELAK
ncbi:hypothetical protein GC169_08695 [bacterium]|nr:hypothetical protein [bacterium]